MTNSPDLKSFSHSPDKDLAKYLEKTFAPEDAILKEIRERSLKLGLPPIQVGTMDALHLEILTRACGAKKAVEIGTLGGYSGVSIARGLKEGGKLYTFEFEPKHADAARESFKRADVSDRVEILVGPALSNLPSIEKHGPFDLVFIDADKVSYPAYLDWAAKHLRVGGIVLADNTFAWGLIAQEKIDDPEDLAAATALRKFNAAAAQGGHFRATILPTGEGLTMAVKIKN